MCWRRCYSLYQCNQFTCRPPSSPFVVNDAIHFHISNKSCLRSSKLSAFHFFPCLLSERDTRETKISHTWGIYRERKSSCWIWWRGSSEDDGKKRDCPGEDAIAWTQFMQFNIAHANYAEKRNSRKECTWWVLPSTHVLRRPWLYHCKTLQFTLWFKLRAVLQGNQFIYYIFSS